MNSQQITESIRRGELQLTGFQKFDHYSLSLYLLIPGTMLIGFHLFGSEESAISLTEVVVISAIFTGLAVLVYFIQKRRLGMVEVKTGGLSREEIDAVIENVADKLEWERSTRNKRAYIATTHPRLWSGSWGEYITVLFRGNSVFINSICDPDKQTSVVSMGRNRKNVETLANALRSAQFGRTIPETVTSRSAPAGRPSRRRRR